MPVPSTITDLSAVAASNSPAGTDSPNTLDDIQRAHASFIRQLHDGTTKPAWSAAFSIPFFDASGNYGSASTFVRDGSGNVGIGTASPSQALDVVRAAAAATVRVARTGVSAVNISSDGIIATDSCDMTLNAPGVANVITMRTAGSERLSIDASGNTKPGADGTQMFGAAAFRWSAVYARQINLTPPASATPAVNGEAVFELTSDTTLKLKVRGSDGVVRSVSLTLV